jgi:hypothetical protein
MTASGTTVRTSTRPAARACGDTGGGSADAEGTWIIAAHITPTTATIHLLRATTQPVCNPSR